MHLILASGSPRRRQLLKDAGYEFDVIVPDASVECGVCRQTGPAELVAELAYRKAVDVVRRIATDERVDTGDEPTCDANPRVSEMAAGTVAPAKIVIAADTVAECGGQILGKPNDEQHAGEMLRYVSGREHRVYSGICVWPVLAGTEASVAVGDAAVDSVGHLLLASPEAPSRGPTVRVAATTLCMDELTDAQLDEYLESGGWKGKAGAFGYQDRLGWVHIVEGSESNVVGLPMELVSKMLRDAGYPS